MQWGFKGKSIDIEIKVWFSSLKRAREGGTCSEGLFVIEIAQFNETLTENEFLIKSISFYLKAKNVNLDFLKRPVKLE